MPSESTAEEAATVYLLVMQVAGTVRVEVRDVDNFRELAVRVDGVADDAAVVAVRDGGLGEFAGDHVWLDTAALRRSGSDTRQWRDGYDGMLAYAAGSGWTSEDGSRVRAHVVRL